jgi:F-type H+-transporting ATPase subunit b
MSFDIVCDAARASLASIANLDNHVLNGSDSVGAVNVDFDLSIVVQVVFFVFLLIVLKPLLFDPMLKLFEAREMRIDGAKLQARRMDEASAGALTKYENEMKLARASANAERDKLRGEGLKTEAEILAKVREKTAKALEEGRARVHGEVEIARSALVQDGATLAKDLAARVLGREVH